MRAVRLLEAGRLEVFDTDMPEPAAGEVRLRVSACGICGSDLTSYKSGLFEGVPGHELAGVVEKLGPGVEGWAVGDAAGIDPRLPCGECEQCRAGHGHRCVDSLTRKTVTPGGFAERVTAPLSVLRRLPEGLVPEIACLAEPLAVGLHGVDQVRLAPGEDAIVIGLGSIGLLATAALRARGAGRIVGVDPVARRRDLAARLGADTLFKSGADATAALDGPPVVLECSGRPDSIGLAVNLAGQGGRVALLGIPLDQVTLYAVMWIIHEVSVVGSINSTGANYREALGVLARTPAIGDIITSRVPLAGVPDAFERMLHPSGEGKIVVDPRR